MRSKPNLELDHIIQVISNYLDIKICVIKSRKRTFYPVLARHLFYFFAYQKNKYSLDYIGGYLGFDHATAIYGINRVQNMQAVGLKQDLQIISDISEMLGKTSWFDIYGDKTLQKFDTKLLETIKKYVDEILKERNYGTN